MKHLTHPTLQLLTHLASLTRFSLLLPGAHAVCGPPAVDLIIGFGSGRAPPS